MNLDFKISSENIILDFGNFEDWENGASSVPTEYTLSGTGAAVARESSIVKFGNYSAKITSGSAAAELYRDVEGLVSHYIGRKFTYGAWVRCSTASKARIQINDGVGTSSSSYHTGSGEWEFLEVTRDLDGSATRLRIINAVAATLIVAYFDGSILCEGDTLFTELSDDDIMLSACKATNSFAIDEAQIPKRPGKIIFNQILLSKKFNLSGTVVGSTSTLARTNLDTLKRALFKGKKDLYLNDDRVLKVYLDRFKDDMQAAGKFFKFSLSFRLDDNPVSMYFNKTRVVQAITSSPTSFDVANGGNIETQPIIRFIAGGTDITTITFENLTNGEVFSYTGTVTAGDELVIDTSEQTVENDGVDDLANWSNGDFLKLELGTNKFKYTGSNCTIKVDFFARYC